MSRHRHAGFSLIELVTVLIVISVGLLGMASLFTTSNDSLGTNETLQKATQYAQECAENLITKRRAKVLQFKPLDSTPTVVPPISCGAANSIPAEFIRLPNDDNPDTAPLTTGGTTSACPDGVLCRTIPITVTSAANTALSSSVTIMLVDY